MNFKYSTLGFDKIYVINLKRRSDRKEQLLAKFPNINFTFIEAIDGKELDQETLIAEEKLNRSFFDPTGMVTMGIFACALSHKKAWDQAIEDGVENALFLEDDVYPIVPLVEENRFTEVYQLVLNDIKQYDWDLIHLGKKTEFQSGMDVSNFLTVPRYNSNYNGAHAYCATSEMIKTLSSNYLPVKYAADVYLEQFYKSHNIFTFRQSLIRQVSDSIDPQNADSDTYYNSYREGGGKVGISFDEKGNVLNRQVVKYIKHPYDLLDNYTECVLEKPKFGIQKFNKKGFFGVSDLLKHLSNFLDKDPQMIELFSHTGENTFFFGCSSLFKNIYCIDPLKGEDKFNIDNNLVWEDVKNAFHNNTYHFENINLIEKQPLDTVDSFKDISFLYINKRTTQSINSLIKAYLPTLKKDGYIGGDKSIGLTKARVFTDGSWIIRKEDVTDL